MSFDSEYRELFVDEKVKELREFVEERWDQLKSLYAGSECYVQMEQ